MAAHKLKLYIDNAPGIPAIFLITEALVKEALARRPGLAERVEVTIGSGPAAMEANLREAEAFAGWLFPKERLAAMAPKLRWLHFIGAGLDHVLPLDWLPPGLLLTRASGAHRPKIDEFMMMALLLLNNRIPEIAANQRKGRFDYCYSSVITGKTALLIGLGAAGSAAAAACKTLGLKVLAVRHDPAPHPDAEEVHGPEALLSLLPRADFVVITVPKTKATMGILDRKAIQAMKPGAGLVSLARLGLIDEEALMERLESGQLSGAVYDIEDPTHVPSSPRLWSTERLFIMPHSLTNDPQRFTPNTIEILCENLERYLAGRPLLNRIDPAKEY